MKIYEVSMNCPSNGIVGDLFQDYPEEGEIITVWRRVVFPKLPTVFAECVGKRNKLYTIYPGRVSCPLKLGYHYRVTEVIEAIRHYTDYSTSARFFSLEEL